MKEFLTPVNDSILLRQSSQGLLFGTDAYLLAAYVRRKARGRAYDLGSGSGAVALLTARNRMFSTITALELQADSYALLCHNVETNNMGQRIIPVLADVRTYTPSGEEKAADWVFCNPPYFSANTGFARKSMQSEIARREIAGEIFDFCSCAARLLRYGGYFTVCFLPERITDLLCAMRENGLEPKRMTLVYPTALHRPSLLLVEAKKGGAPGVFWTKPLVLSRSAGNNTLCHTPEYTYIYENGAFDEQYEKP